MDKLDRNNYCLSCEHILAEQGFVFEEYPPYMGEPINTENKKCANCKQTINNNLELIKNDYNTFKTALVNNKIKVVAFVAPSIRAGIGECFNVTEDCQYKIVTALKQLGCSFVYSMNFGADLTITEESAELKERLNNNTNLPLLTSCCPSWINFVYKVYPALKKNLSTCKSPQQMMGAIINNYFTKVNNLKSSDIFVVSIVPCLAKKLERQRENINFSKGFDVDACITTTELAQLIKEHNIDFNNLANTEFDNLFKEYSNNAALFGIAGGVSQSIIYNLDKDAVLLEEKITNIKEKTFLVNNKKVCVAQIEGLANTKDVINQILNGNCKYHIIEVMACSGGCVGGAGQLVQNADILKRTELMKTSKNNYCFTNANDNPIIKELYKKHISKELAHKMFHENRE